jgi:hypothetical protein
MHAHVRGFLEINGKMMKDKINGVHISSIDPSCRFFTSFVQLRILAVTSRGVIPHVGYHRPVQG